MKLLVFHTTLFIHNAPAILYIYKSKDKNSAEILANKTKYVKTEKGTNFMLIAGC